LTPVCFDAVCINPRVSDPGYSIPSPNTQ
jgi:hypothetical protein